MTDPQRRQMDTDKATHPICVYLWHLDKHLHHRFTTVT
jgi:hypothetical protein